MRRIRFLLLTALCAALLLIICAAPACAVTYADGDYTVPFSMEGLGRHNIAWSTATVHVEGGALFVDFTVERVDPRNHAPQFDWLQTPAGTATPILNDETYTATFLRVPVPDLGRVDVTVQSSGMSAPVLLDYTIVIDGSGIPEASAATPSPAPSPAPTQTPAVAPDLTPAPTQAPTPTPVLPAETASAPNPAPAPEQTPSPAPAPAPAATETPKTEPAPAPSAPPVPVTGTGAETPAKTGNVGTIALIAGIAVVVIGGAAALVLRRRK